MDKIEKIRQEIERLIEMNKTKNGFPAGTICAVRIEAYGHLLSFLDTLSEEPNKSLEKAADDYIGEVVDTAGHPGWDWETHDIIEAFKAGAKWGIKSQEKMIADAYEKGKQEGIRVVRSWESSPGQGGY